MAGMNDRLEERKSAYMPVKISSQEVRCLGIMSDISRSGGRLQIRLVNRVERVGVVRRCMPAAVSTKYDIGFELMDSCWPDELLATGE
jgi:hypothetical protein